jgi:hypothetical protein
LSFKAAPGLGGPASPVTVIVGPNNSGKSLALREILSWAEGTEETRRVVEELDVEWPTDAAGALTQLTPFVVEPEGDEAVEPNIIILAPFRMDGSGANRHRLNTETLAHQLTGPPPDTAWLRSAVLKCFAARLDGRTRFALMEPRAFQDLQRSPQHHLAALFKDDALRARVREMIEQAFPGRYFVIDPTGGQQFRVRMSDRPPADGAEERGWDERAVAFHGEATLIEDLSDGLVSFSGLIAAAVSLPHRILLVDEPEAFLHPPLARQLGSNLAFLTKERGASLVAATHSSEFLMGCIASGVETTIVRLTYDSGVAGVRVLVPGELKELIRDPLLRSTDALSGLFHRGVVVAESDHDRAFYEEINRRLVEEDERGSPDTFFTNAQNWQTIPRIIGPLRQLGVPAAAIVDLDTVCEGKTEWDKFYKVMNAAESEIEAVNKLRNEVRQALRALPDKAYKKSGIGGLGKADQARARRLFEKLADFGIFVVEVGELEGWLAALGLQESGGKGGWIVKAFQKLGSNPDGAAYVKPAADDVWEFLDRLAAWVGDPDRLGLPAAEP